MNIIWMLRKLLGFEEVYTIASRTKIDSKDSLLKDGLYYFTAVSELKDFWYADPILYEQDGKTFCFFELLNRKTLKGSIAVSELLKDGSLGSYTVVIEELFHLSFPFVFAFDDGVYMLPESGESMMLNFYECIKFPYEWKRHTQISTDKFFADHVVISTEVGHFVINTILESSNPLKTQMHGYKLKMKDNRFCLEEIIENQWKLQRPSFEVRNAGAFFVADGICYRPTQESAPYQYGIALRFNRVEYLGEHDYQESFCQRIDNVSNKICLCNSNRHILGIHTYSVTDSYEVIDVKFEVFNPLKWLYRIKRMIKHHKA